MGDIKRIAGASAISPDGVLQSIVTEQEIKTLRDNHRFALEDTNKRGKLWSRHKEEYTKLKSVLSSIDQKTSHQTMVPLGPKAYMEGTLVHTNEIMVLLGDNWFAERSASQASEICDRRIVQCDAMLSKLNDELKLVQSWLKEAETLAKGGGVDGDQGKEIREPYDSDEEKRWKEEHKEKIKKFNKSKKKTESVIDEDEQLWKKLDELEIQEELDAYLENQKGDEKHCDNISENEISDEGSQDWSESPGLTDDEEESEEIGEKERIANGSSDQSSGLKDNVENPGTIKQQNGSTTINQPIVEYIPETKDNILNREGNNSRLSATTKVAGKGTVQPGTRRVSFGSISEYEYQRDVEYKSSKHDVLSRHSWSEHSTPANIKQSIPEHDTSAKQSKSLSMEALAESLAQINAGKVLTFDESTIKAPASTNECKKEANSQLNAKISTASGESESSESLTLQKTPTLFFTHYEEEEDDEVNSKWRHEENRYFSTYSDITAIEPCDTDFVYDSVPKNPADILRLYGFRRSSIDRPRLKGILKPSGSSHSLIDSADDASVSDTSLAKSPASLQSSGRFKISPTRIPENVVNTLLSSSPINSTASLRSSPGGSRFSISPTKISDPSIFTPPEKPYVQPHHRSVDSGSSPSRFSINRIDENTFVPPTQLEIIGDTDKEKENVPVNAIVQEKNPVPSSSISELTAHPPESGDGGKGGYSTTQENTNGRKESRFKVSRGIKRAKEDKT